MKELLYIAGGLIGPLASYASTCIEGLKVSCLRTDNYLNDNSDFHVKLLRDGTALK